MLLSPKIDSVYKLNSSFGGLKFGKDSDGNYGYIKDGADTVTPFSKIYRIPNFAFARSQQTWASVFSEEKIYDASSYEKFLFSWYLGIGTLDSTFEFDIFGYDSSGNKTKIFTHSTNNVSAYCEYGWEEFNITQYSKISIRAHTNYIGICRLINMVMY